MLDTEVRTYHRVLGRHPRARLFARLFAVTTILSIATTAAMKYADPSFDWRIMAVILPVIGFTIWRSTGKTMAMMSSYQLTLGPRLLRMVASSMTTLEALGSDITRIIEQRRHGLVLTIDGRHYLVPRDLDGYAEVRARLAAWHPITSGSAAVARAWALLLLCLGANLALFALPHPSLLVVMALALVVCGTLGWTAREILRSRMTSRLKATYLVGLAIYTLMPVAKLSVVLLTVQK
jgi:hypothetical protein